MTEDIDQLLKRGNCRHQNTYDVHTYCSLTKQKSIFCIHHLEEKDCPFYEERKEETP